MNISHSKFRQMKHYKLGSNYISGLIAKALLLFAPLITTPLIFINLDIDDVGFYFYVGQVCAVILLADFGINSTLSRLIPKVKASNPEAAESLLATCFWTLVFFAVSVFAVFLFSVDTVLSGLGDLNQSEYANYRATLVTAAAIACSSLPLRMGHGVLIANHDFRATQKLEVVGVFFRVGLIYLATTRESTVVFWLAIATQLGLALISLSVFYRSLRYLRLGALKPTNFRLSHLLDILSISLASLGVTLSAAATFQGSALFVSYFLGLDANAIYSLVILFFRSLTPFFQILPTLLNPIAAEGHERGKEDAKLIYFIGIQLTSAFIIFALIWVWYLVTTLLDSWLNNPELSFEKFMQVRQCLLLLIIGYFMSLPSAFGRSVAFGAGRHFHAMLLEIVAALILIGLLFTTLLIETSVEAVSFVVAMAMAIRGILIYPPLIARIFNLTTVSVLHYCFTKVIFAGLWLSLILIINVHYIPDLLMTNIFLEPTVLSFLWLVILYVCILDSSQRTFVKERLVERR